METKHTPGPWAIDKILITKNKLRTVVVGDDDDSGAVCTVHETEYKKANAALIAAAPDLLEALMFVQTALADWRDGKDTTNHPEHGNLNLEEVKYCVVDAAIRKATE